MLNALRLVEGFPVALFAQRTGLSITVVDAPLRAAEARGLIERDHATIRPTPKGRRFLNDLLETFLPGSRPRRTTIPINIASPGTSRSS
jgi:oxygen-independent coproporphyrinogen-3 oxidase